MKKTIGFLIFAFVMLVPFRMVYFETGNHSNVTHVLLFLSILLSVFIGVILIEDKQTQK